MGRWRTRAVAVPVRMGSVRGLWGRAWRVNAHTSTRLRTRGTTILLGSPDAPIGWLAVRWRLPGDSFGLIHRIGWDATAGRDQLDVWRVIDDLLGDPVPQPTVAVRESLAPPAA